MNKMKNAKIYLSSNTIHNGFFKAIIDDDGDLYKIQCEAVYTGINFNDCGYDWGECAKLNKKLADEIGWDGVLELLKRAYDEYNKKNEELLGKLNSGIFLYTPEQLDYLR